MGGGASTNLTSDQKADVSKTLQGKYRELIDDNGSNAGASTESEGGGSTRSKDKDVELFKTLSSVYEEKVMQIKAGNSIDTGSISSSQFDDSSILSPSKMLEKFKNIKLDDDDDDLNNVDTFDVNVDSFKGGRPFENSFNSTSSTSIDSPLPGGMTKKRQSFRDAGRQPSFDIDTDFDPSHLTAHQQSTIDLLAMAEQQANESAARLSTFIAGLKDNQESKASDFRARRLTFGTKTEMKPEPGSNRRDSKALARKRTSIFSSSEIGVKQEKKPPFPDSIFGTYSCHGIEPDPISDTGTHEKINQDRGCVVCPFNSQPNESLFMVLDGHGEEGDKVSEFVMRQIVLTLEKHPQITTDPVAALKDSYIKSNTALMSTQINYMASGCTCVGVYMVGSHYFVANVGDSRAVLATTRDKKLDEYGQVRVMAKDLSKDHKPDDPIEQKRIHDSGGFVCPSPEPGITARVYLDDKFTMIGLAMSRSIGDYSVKTVGVIPEPEVFEYDLHPDDQFIILASDGVWEFISSQEAVDIVQDSLEYGALVACQELIETAAYRWQEIEGDYRDDITAIIFKLPLPINK